MTRPLDTSRLHFKNTAAQLGRSSSVSPQNSQLEHLSYGRIRLAPELPGVRFETHAHETALICLSGSAPAAQSGLVCMLHDAAVFDTPQAYTRVFVAWYRRCGKAST